MSERTILEQILEELILLRDERKRDRAALLAVLGTVSAIAAELLPEAISMTYDTSAVPFQPDGDENDDTNDNTKENSHMGAPATLQVGQAGFGRVIEWSGPAGTGTQVPPPGPKGIIFASDNTVVATVDTAGNPTGVGVGTANVSAFDQDNNLTDTSVVTVVAAPPPPPVTAVSMTFDTSATPFTS